MHDRHHGLHFPPMRLETVYCDRVVRCFAERPASLTEVLKRAVACNPDGIALVCEESRLGYRTLEAMINRAAAALLRSGIGKGDRVALLLGNRIEFVVLLFAAARVGAIVVPLSIRDRKPGLSYALEHCGARLLILEAGLSSSVPSLEELPHCGLRVSLGGSTGVAAVPWDDWLAPIAADAPPPAVEPGCGSDAAAILYTSGTTGRPKGAILTHLGLVHSAMHYVHAMSLGPRDCSIATVPLSHVTGLVALVATMVLAAGKLVVMPNFRASTFLELAQTERMTHTLMVPAMYKLCLLEPGFSRADLSAWRIGAYGGAPMPVATIGDLAGVLPGLVLMNCYGATETTSPATLMPPGQGEGRTDSVGCALPCAEVCVMDERGTERAEGELGEIWIRGPMVVPGYWNNPEATRDSFIAGFWRSGDLGWVDSDGYLRVVDRIKDMINRGGYKVFTIEVENVLHEHPSVVECAVVAVPCPVLGERVHAVIHPKSFEGLAGDGPTEKLSGSTVGEAAAHDAGRLVAELRQHCEVRLTDYKVPEAFTVVNQPLPRNANGKLLKRLIREQVLARVAGAPVLAG